MLLPARRASLLLHYRLHRRAYSRKAPLSTLDKLQQTPAEAPPRRRRLGVNQQKAQLPTPPPELSGGPVSCLGKDAPLPLGKAELPSTRVSVSKPSRSQKRASRKQNVGSRGDLEEDTQRHSVYVTDSSFNAKLSASKTSCNDSIKLVVIDQGLCNDGDANFESTACRHHAAKVESSRVFECPTCSKDSKDHSYHGVLTVDESKVCSSPLADSAVLSTTEWGCKLPSSDCSVPSGFTASETRAFAKGNDAGVHGPSNSADLSTTLLLLKNASETELLRKVRLAEQLSPSTAASLLKKRSFKICSFDQFESVFRVFENCLLSSERAFRVLVRRPEFLLHSADLLQQKLQVFVNFQFEKETICKVCLRGTVLKTSANSLQERFAFLEELGLNVEARNKIFYKEPVSTTFTFQNFKRTLDFLSGKGVTKEGILRLVQRCPQLLRISCDKNLAPRYHFFQQIGVPAPHLPRAVCLASRTSIDTLKAHMGSLEDLGFSHDEICVMVQKDPDLVRACNFQRLKMTLGYLLHEQKYNMAEIAKYPKGLSVSLESRIIPRCKLLEERGLSRVYALSTILSYSDSRFSKLLSKRSDMACGFWP